MAVPAPVVGVTRTWWPFSDCPQGRFMTDEPSRGVLEVEAYFGRIGSWRYEVRTAERG